MPSPTPTTRRSNRFDPRSYFGFTGQPLATPDGNAPGAIADRFKRHGQEAFLPYVDPFATLAKGQQYDRAGHALDIAEAENEFMDNLGTISQNPSGLQEFLQKHPQAAFSPMLQTWKKMQTTRKDPFEAMVAREGADYLQAYRAAVQSGQEPMEAFAEFRTVVKKEADGKKASEDDELFFVKEGGDIEDFVALKEKGASRGQMLDFINKKGKAPTTTEASKYSKLKAELESAERSMESYKEMEEDEYEKEIETALGKAPVTKEDWDAGYMILKEKKIGPKRQALEEFEAGLVEQGKRIPGRGNVPRGTPAAAPAPVAPGAAPSKVMGYDVRKPFQGEDDYFKKNPTVAGMAAEDGKIVLNPYSKLTDAEKSAVAQNEAIRLKMRETGFSPSFSLTEKQRRQFEGTAYAKDERAAKQTIIARILTGDPSAGDVTEEQRAEAEKFKKTIGTGPTSPIAAVRTPGLSPLSEVRKMLKP